MTVLCFYGNLQSHQSKSVVTGSIESVSLAGCGGDAPGPTGLSLQFRRLAAGGGICGGLENWRGREAPLSLGSGSRLPAPRAWLPAPGSPRPAPRARHGAVSLRTRSRGEGVWGRGRQCRRIRPQSAAPPSLEAAGMEPPLPVGVQPLAVSAWEKGGGEAAWGGAGVRGTADRGGGAARGRSGPEAELSGGAGPAREALSPTLGREGGLRGGSLPPPHTAGPLPGSASRRDPWLAPAYYRGYGDEGSCPGALRPNPSPEERAVWVSNHLIPTEEGSLPLLPNPKPRQATHPPPTEAAQATGSGPGVTCQCSNRRALSSASKPVDWLVLSVWLSGRTQWAGKQEAWVLSSCPCNWHGLCNPGLVNKAFWALVSSSV